MGWRRMGRHVLDCGDSSGLLLADDYPMQATQACIGILAYGKFHSGEGTAQGNCVCVSLQFEVCGWLEGASPGDLGGLLDSEAGFFCVMGGWGQDKADGRGFGVDLYGVESSCVQGEPETDRGD